MTPRKKIKMDEEKLKNSPFVDDIPQYIYSNKSCLQTCEFIAQNTAFIGLFVGNFLFRTRYGVTIW